MSRRSSLPSILRAVIVLLTLLGAIASPASAQNPTAPASGAQVTETDVVVRWTLEPNTYSQCVQWASGPDTAYAGGPFLVPDETDCDLSPYDTAYLLDELEVRRYYWHVKTVREVCDDEYDCREDGGWGPTAYLDSVEPPPPPAPTGCSKQAASFVADEFILPFARKREPRYYRDVEPDMWQPAGPVCRDLNGDGDREMIVRLLCCTGGSLSPWAIFTHDRAGQWRMAYAQASDTVFRLSVRARTVRTMLPAPYEGACTRRVRYRTVRWTGSRFASTLTRRVRAPHRGC